jgi:hypothetical protein
MYIGVVMERTRAFALVAIALLIVPLAWSYVIEIDPWWLLSVAVIGALVLLWALLPRPKDPEITGEDVYHLHP